MLDSSHKLHKFLPQENVNTYNLRSQCHFQAYKARTNRFKHSFFPLWQIFKTLQQQLIIKYLVFVSQGYNKVDKRLVITTCANQDPLQATTGNMKLV